MFFAALMAAFILGEVVTINMFVGGAFLFLAVVALSIIESREVRGV